MAVYIRESNGLGGYKYFCSEHGFDEIEVDPMHELDRLNWLWQQLATRTEPKNDELMALVAIDRICGNGDTLSDPMKLARLVEDMGRKVAELEENQRTPFDGDGEEIERLINLTGQRAKGESSTLETLEKCIKDLMNPTGYVAADGEYVPVDDLDDYCRKQYRKNDKQVECYEFEAVAYREDVEFRVVDNGPNVEPSVVPN